jgi:hypothetical protein
VKIQYSEHEADEVVRVFLNAIKADYALDDPDRQILDYDWFYDPAKKMLLLRLKIEDELMPDLTNDEN